ncbi:FAD-dependent monooxygenase [Undibacterium sp. RTI2.1]|uniref:FAD-dependent monooxygenase n=1 Tax=unclassified Undibacterium TaxID=2630295 RepID=UPI002AB4D210|nr:MULTISPECIES: FAD-dependent monooxygenase [unclassified Undibacterium]MDY7536659.1 FAD-dependent monooxygenase [Undibacterium sp. 5I1]MEB0032359.1 FAD-dependent monooxygenase [Undibacterium sp. RTI2.1]MEB0118457.1 FAD-dependent monooxygenase [Undibacterium sp. RTI2.2]MEB0230296.1 FAD-dependent monooxygenase [Undibacterium sp. 10I3]MEB0257996.1 FAD-dependent monooxygenase [Undibacterium sp. 5I1]
MKLTDFHIAICGAGPVGQCLALLLCKQGIAADRILLLDAKTSAQAEQDARSIALSYGSQQILTNAGAWPIKATSIRQIHVSRRGHFGRSLIDCKDYSIPALGYVARYGDIIAPLQQATEQRGIQIKRPATVAALEESDDAVTLTLQNGEKITATIVVQAEGGTFGNQMQKVRSVDYQQTAIISHITVSQSVAQRAFERFTEQGPLALLPQEDGYALVWCVRPPSAEQLLGLDDNAFKAALQQAFGQRLGQILTASPRHSYPLGLNAQAQATKRIVTIGNAAQTLHPVAGQGLNLGLRDAKILASTLAEIPLQDESSQPTAAQQVGEQLQFFLKQRQTDRNTTIRLTDSMARIFASAPDGALTQSIFGLGLGLLDIVQPAKKILAEQMMFGWR